MARSWIPRCPCCRLCLLLLIPAVPGRGEIVLKSECDASRTLRIQTVYTQPGWSCLLNVSRAGDAPANIRAGLECAALTAGPVRRAGLLRLLFRPLRYRPGSDLFREHSGLELDRSLGGGRLDGLLIEPRPGRLGLFAFAAPGREAAGGGFLRLGGAEGARLEALALASRPPPQQQGEEWISVPAPYPGGRLLHLGLRAGGEFPPLALDLSAVASGGERSPPGYLLQLAADCGLKGADLALVGGLCSPAFLTPGGRGGLPRCQAGLRTRLGSETRLQVSALAEFLLAPGTDGGVPGLRWESRTELSARLALPARGASWRLEGGFVAETRPEAGEAGEALRRALPEAGVTREVPDRTLTLGWRGGREERLKLEACGGRPGLRWRGALEAGRNPDLCFKAGGACELERERGRFYARFSCREWLSPAQLSRGKLSGLMKLTSITLGWETAAPAPGSGPGDG